tara:strand:+ start:501 stop:683 length:183 start_codon:yes stop_codon:yes gene_type:complete
MGKSFLVGSTREAQTTIFTFLKKTSCVFLANRYLVQTIWQSPLGTYNIVPTWDATKGLLL